MSSIIKNFQEDIQTIQNEARAQEAREQAALKLQEDKSKHTKSFKPPPVGHTPVEGSKQPDDDTEIDVQALLLTPSTDETSTASLKSHLSIALLRAQGEVLLNLGQRKDAAKYWLSEGSSTLEEVGTVGTKLGSEDELKGCVERLKAIVEDMGGQATVLSQHTSPSPNAYILVRLVPASIEEITEVRVACAGNVDAGKSTTLGCLTRGSLDDGRGRTRLNLFRHKHEIESGRTSSVGMEILGFSPSGSPVVPSVHATAASKDEDSTAASATSSAGSAARREKLSWDQICKQSTKVLSFIDLAGHERYLKTTMFGLTGCSPDYCMLMVGGNAGLIGMSKEHLAVALALAVPIIVCITKIDMTPPHILEATKKQLFKILRSPGCRKVPCIVQSVDDALDLSREFVKEKLCPIFEISNVTGAGLDNLRSFLNVLPTGQGHPEKYDRDSPLEFSISDVFSVPFVGTVVSGVLLSGRVKQGDNVLLGPDSLGHFVTTNVKSIQRKRAAVEYAEAGQSVSFALKRVRRAAVRKGMVVVAKTEEPPKAVRRFEGQILVLYHNTTIQPRYQAVLHCGSIRQTVRIVSIEGAEGRVLRTGDRASVLFEFVGAPEYVKVGMKLLFREGKTKGLGVVSRVGV